MNGLLTNSIFMFLKLRLYTATSYIKYENKKSRHLFKAT